MMNSIKKTNLFALLLVGIFFAVSFAVGQIPALQKINASLLLDGCLIAAVLFYCAAGRRNPLTFLRIRRVSFQTLCVIAVMAIVSLPLISFINFLSMLFASNYVVEGINQSVGQNFAWALFTIAVVPAIVEECTYRGAILGGYREEDSSFKAIAVSALLFAALHMNFNQMSYAFVLGLFMGILVELTDSIWASIWFHFCINGMSVQSAWVMQREGNEMAQSAGKGLEELMQSPLQTGLLLAPMALISLILVILLIYFIARINKTTHVIGDWFFGKGEKILVTEDGFIIRNRTKYLDVFSILALIFCFAVAVISELVQ